MAYQPRTAFSGNASINASQDRRDSLCMKICELCQRDCPKLTEHHLVPRQQTKRKKKRKRQGYAKDLGPTIDICPPCHKQVHTLFSNKALATTLHSADLLRSHPAMEKFLNWVTKQDPYKRIRTRR